MEHVQNVKRLKETVKHIYQGLNRHGVVSNKRILSDPTKKGKQNSISVPLFDNDRNLLYEQFESISDLVSQSSTITLKIGDLIELTSKIKQVDIQLYQ